MPSPIDSDDTPMIPASPSDTLIEIENFREILESVPDAIVVADRDGRMVMINSRTEKLFGFDRSELLGRSIDILLPERFRGERAGHCSPFLCTPGIQPMDPEFNLYGLRRDGFEFPIEIGVSSLEHKRGTLFIASIHDLTKRKRFEDCLRGRMGELAQINQAKDRFLAGLSHELCTPLNAIVGFAGTLLMRLPGPLTAAQEKQLRIIQTSAKHLLSLINDLLDLAKIESGKLKPNPESFVCQEAIREVAETLYPMAEKKGLGFSLILPPENILVETDRRAFVQIVINLANNAIKFTPRGEISIKLMLRQKNGSRMVDISVSDTGVGVKPEDQGRLFQPFTQVNADTSGRGEGAGLGLYLSQKLASLIGGYIVVHSEYGTGSTFTFSLPAKRSD